MKLARYTANCQSDARAGRMTASIDVHGAKGIAKRSFWGKCVSKAKLLRECGIFASLYFFSVAKA